MSILTFENIGQSFGAVDIFSGLSGKIEIDSKIGLVGANGIGKSTLLQILAGITESSAGKISLRQGIRVGYLRQEAVTAFADSERKLYDEMQSAFDDLRAMEARMREIETLMTEGADDQSIYDEYSDLQEEFDFRNGYDTEHQIERTLSGLGFEKDDYDIPLELLSGGQQTRALLARLLLSAPHLLILDEPTNHLDMDAVAWLEGALRLWRGAVLIVSHDRYFLDRVVEDIWEMSYFGMEVYKGNYTAHLQQRRHRHERLSKEWDSVQERWASEFAFIEKHTLADTNAMGRFKRLTREVEAVSTHGIEALRYIKQHGWAQYTNNFLRSNPPQSVRELRQAMRGIPHPIKRQKEMRLKLASAERGGDIVMRVRNLTVGYETEKPLFSLNEAEITRQNVVALIGDNGAGKSSLLKTALRQIEPLRGRITFGSGIKVGYFAQAHDTLNPTLTVIQEISQHKKMTPGEARNLLARFLFRGDDVFKEISDLSGGERGRLALAILSLKKANLLLMDEPTNHLDIPAQEILQEVLEGYDGTIVLVSHDRYLIDRLATQIWDVRDGKINIFKGTYQEYLAHLAGQEVKTRIKKPKTALPKQSPQLLQLEKRISAIEAQVKELATLIERASTSGKQGQVEQLGQAYAEHQNQLDRLLEEWEVLAEEA